MVLANKRESIKTWAIIILVIAVALGGIRLKRQADLLEAHANAVRHREQQDYEAITAAKENARDEYEDQTYTNLLIAVVYEVRGGAVNDEGLQEASPEEREGWLAGRRDGYAAGQAQTDVMASFKAPDNDQGSFLYGTAFLANYLRACIEQRNECPQLNVPFKLWFDLETPEASMSAPQSDPNQPIV